MKKTSTLTSIGLFVILAVYTVLNSSYSGLSGGQFTSYSGTPCTACHGSGGTSISINGLPAAYSHGQSYPISVTVTNPSQIIAGFQLQTNIGTLTTSDPSINIYSNNRSAGHGAPKAMTGGVGTFNLIWTAPSSGNMSANFGTQGIAANGNGNTSGDAGTFLTFSNIPLPVRFLDIQARAYNKHIEIEFETTNELNTKEYLLERKQDNDFKTIQSIKPKRSGIYKLVDNSAKKGKTYQYRIKEISLENEVVYSTVVSARISAVDGIKIYPTVIKNNMLQIAGMNNEFDYRFKLIDIFGKVHQTGTLKNSQLELMPSASGTFIFVLYENNFPILTDKILFNQN